MKDVRRPRNLLHVSERLWCDGRLIAERIERAEGWRARVRGLLGAPALAVGEGLLLTGARQIHTLGMRFPIDVIFIDRDRRVLHVVRDMRPQRVTKIVWRARSAVELPAGASAGIVVGARCEIRSGS